MALCIDVEPLTRLRRSYRLRRRAPLVAWYLFLSYTVWMTLVVGGDGGKVYFPFEPEWADIYGVSPGPTWAFLGSILGIFILAHFRRDRAGRLAFALAGTIFCLGQGLMVAFLFYEAITNPEDWLFLGMCGVVILSVTYFLPGRGTWLLWQSCLPLGRQVFALAYAHERARRQRRNAQRRATKATGARDSAASFARFLALEATVLLAGLVTFGISMIGIFNGLASQVADENGMPAWADAFRIIEAWGIPPLILFAKAMLGYSLLILFGFLWQRRRKQRIDARRLVSAGVLPVGGVLLLRHSRDDEIRIPSRRFRLRRLPLWPFDYAFTFEELLTERLAFVGPLYSLASVREQGPIWDRVLDTLASFGARRIAGRWPKVHRRLEAVLAYLRRHLPRRLTPAGATRLYLDDSLWHSYVRDALPRSRAVVLILGDARDGGLISTALAEEMDWLRQGGFLDRTLFLLPPLIGKGELVRRWQAFGTFLLADAGRGIELPVVDKVLAVCFDDGQPVFLLGKERTEYAYESALDVAGTFIGWPEARPALLGMP